MTNHTRSRETTAPADRVWQIWSDVQTWPAWNPDVRSIALDGAFTGGTEGSMTTGAGTHRIRLDNVVPERSFDLVTSPLPLTTFTFHCELEPSQSSTRISQGVTMSGPLAPVLSVLMGNRIANSFVPILAGLAQDAEGRAGS